MSATHSFFNTNLKKNETEVTSRLVFARGCVYLNAVKYVYHVHILQALDPAKNTLSPYLFILCLRVSEDDEDEELSRFGRTSGS